MKKGWSGGWSEKCQFFSATLLSIISTVENRVLRCLGFMQQFFGIPLCNLVCAMPLVPTLPLDHPPITKVLFIFSNLPNRVFSRTPACS